MPDLDGPFAYYTRYREGGQHPLVCRRPATSVAPGLVGDLAGEGEEILIDGDREGEGHAFFSLEDASHSDDHRLVAWSADTKGSELYTIRVRDLATGTDLEDQVLATTGDVVWSGDGRAFWYVAVDENHRPATVMLHRLGTPQSDDETVYEESDSGFFVGIGETQSGAYLVVTANDHETSEVHLAERATPFAPLRVGGKARAQADLLGRASRRRIVRAHQCRRRRGLQDRGGAARRPGPFQLARPDPASRRGDDPLPARLGPPPRAARTGECPAPPDRARRDERRRAQRGVRRGGLFAGPLAGPCLRHGSDPLHLLVDDDAGGDLRLPRDDPRPDLAQAPGRAERPRPGGLRHPPPVRDRAGRGAGAGLAAAPARHAPSTAPRRCCSTATAPTAR